MGGNWRTRRKPTTFGRVLTNSSHVRSEARYRAQTHDLSGGRTSLRRLSHRSPYVSSNLLDTSLLSFTGYFVTSLLSLMKYLKGGLSGSCTARSHSYWRPHFVEFVFKSVDILEILSVNVLLCSFQSVNIPN